MIVLKIEGWRISLSYCGKYETLGLKRKQNIWAAIWGWINGVRVRAEPRGTLVGA